MLIISNRPRSSPSSDFDITRAITPWIVLHSVKLLLLIILHVFSLARDLSKSVSLSNILQLKLRNLRLIFTNFQNRGRCEKYLKENKHNSLHLTLKICSDTCPWTSLSFSPSSQFSLSYTLGKLFASRNRNRQCPRKSFRIYFGARWRLLFIQLYKFETDCISIAR